MPAFRQSAKSPGGKFLRGFCHLALHQKPNHLLSTAAGAETTESLLALASLAMRRRRK